MFKLTKMNNRKKIIEVLNEFCPKAVLIEKAKPFRHDDDIILIKMRVSI